MSRILITLATLSLVLLSCGAVGRSVDRRPATTNPSDETIHWATVHRLTGIAAALGVVFVESVIVTYFIGTSRWCKEVVDDLLTRSRGRPASNRLKRRAFAVALVGMLMVVGVISLGAAADPATAPTKHRRPGPIIILPGRSPGWP